MNHPINNPTESYIAIILDLKQRQTLDDPPPPHPKKSPRPSAPDALPVPLGRPGKRSLLRMGSSDLLPCH